MEYWLAIHPWSGMILWIILYISDYALTIYCARGFRELGYFRFEGSLELTPQFQKDVDALRPVSKRHVILLVLTTALLLLIWWLAQLTFYFPWTYLLFLGIFLFMEVGVHLRHLRNFFLIREIRKNGGVDGQISYRKWFSYKMSASEFYVLSALFLSIALLEYSALFLGGALACLALGASHSRLSKKVRANTVPAIKFPK